MLSNTGLLILFLYLMIFLFYFKYNFLVFRMDIHMTTYKSLDESLLNDDA